MMSGQIPDNTMQQLLSEANQKLADRALDEALILYDRIIDMHAPLSGGNRRLIAEAHMGRGTAFVMQRDQERAEDEIEQASQIFMNMGDSKMGARVSLLARLCDRPLSAMDMAMISTISQSYSSEDRSENVLLMLSDALLEACRSNNGSSPDSA